MEKKSFDFLLKVKFFWINPAMEQTFDDSQSKIPIVTFCSMGNYLLPIIEKKTQKIVCHAQVANILSTNLVLTKQNGSIRVLRFAA